MKTCTKCGVDKPLDDFSKAKRGKYGRKGQCKACCRVVRAAYRERNKEKISEYNREYCRKYYQENKERISAYSQKYYEENRDQVLHRVKEYSAQNKEKITAYQAKYRKSNRAQLSEYSKKYAKKNAEKLRVYQRNYYLTHREDLLLQCREYQVRNPEVYRRSKARRRARKQGNGVLVVSKRDLRRLEREKSERKCAHAKYGPCHEEMTLDHVLPIVRGGVDGIGNLQPMCLHHNTRKGSKLEIEVKRMYLAEMNPIL